MKIALVGLLLVACAPVEREAPPPPPSPPGPEDDCGAARVGDLVGRTRSDALVEEVARRSGAGRVRWIRPGDVVTMDFLSNRLNVYLDARDRIESVACG